MSTLLKKVTSTTSALAIVVAAVSSSLTVSAASEFSTYAEALASAGVINTQSTEAGYRLGDNVTRAEMAKIAVSLGQGETAECAGNVFSDVTSTLGDLCGYVEAAADMGVVSKANAKFRPNDLVTRAEMVKMLLAATGVAPSENSAGFSDVTSAMGDLNGYINAAVEEGIINAGAMFRPNATATRGEAFKVAANVGGLSETTEPPVVTPPVVTPPTGTGVVTPPVTAAGDLMVGLNPKSPASGTQVPMVGTIRFAVVDFSAGGSDISLSTVELKKAGLASIPSGTKVWFEKAGSRISGKASFTSENNAIISFAPAYVVKAGTTESLDMYVEISTTAGNDFQFTSGAIGSSAKNVSGSFVTGVLRTASYTVASATITPSTSAQSYNASSDPIELAKYTIANTDTNSDTRDLKFQSVSLYQSGTANLTNLSNITVERNGVVVSSNAAVSGKVLTLTVNDVIKDGATAIYTVKAVINNVELTTDTYNFYLKNTSDINLVETDSAFRATISSTAPITAAVYSVSGGDVKFERDTSVALSSTVAPGTSDVTLMKGTITAKSAVSLENVTIPYSINSALTSTGAIPVMNTVYLQIGSATFTWTPANGDATFLGTATVSGTVPVRMYTKLKDGASGTIKFSDLNISRFGTKEYTVNQNTVSSAIGSVGGVTITVGASTLNVTRTDGLGATSIPSGTKGVTVYGAKFSSTQGNPVALSNLVVTTSGNATSYTGGNTSLTLYVNGVAKSTKSLTTASVNFDNFNAVVSTTAATDIVIKADFSDVTTAGTFSVSAISYTAVDNITSVTVTPTSVAGATFTIATAVGTLAASTGDNLVNKSLLLAGTATQKIVSFKVTASNDSIKLKNIVLTGANLTSVSNIRLTDASMNVLGTASSVTSTGATFANLDNVAGSAVAIDKSATYYVVADINSSTNQTGVYANVLYTGSTITSSNGSVIALSGADVGGASHDIAENTFKVTQATPVSKDIATDAMRFTVYAFGKNSVTLSGATFSNLLSGYTGSSVLTVVRSSDNAVVGSVSGTTGTVTFTANNSIDAGSSATYIVKLVGTVVNGSSTSQGWTVSMTSLTTSTGLDAASYPKNTDTLPLTSNK